MTPLFFHPLLRDVLGEDALYRGLANPLVDHPAAQSLAPHNPKNIGPRGNCPDPKPIPPFGVTRPQSARIRLVTVNGRFVEHSTPPSFATHQSERRGKWIPGKTSPSAGVE